jgi:peptidyl-tRNA hydrolase, PTH1 family
LLSDKAELENDRYLLVGLGNPGKAYADTRHNIGFRAIEALASKYKWEFRKVRDLYGLLALGEIEGKKVLLLMPETYMNSSGQSVRECMSYYRIALSRLCVVCDDVNLPFGRLRLKPQGSSGGHNGLKSVTAHLGGQEYSRLRIGVGNRGHETLEDYVLSSFREEEKQKLQDLHKKAAEALEYWVIQGSMAAMQLVNMDQDEKKEPDKKLGE